MPLEFEFPGNPFNVEKTLLRYFSEWQGRLKRYQKHVHNVESKNQSCLENRESRVVAKEISLLRDVIRQIHILRAYNKELKKRGNYGEYISANDDNLFERLWTPLYTRIKREDESREGEKNGESTKNT